MTGYANWKFGGKELQENGFYDYGARFYMADIGRFGTHDPLSEKTLDPFGFGNNNPVRFADPTGMDGEDSTGGGEKISQNGGGSGIAQPAGGGTTLIDVGGGNLIEDHPDNYGMMLSQTLVGGAVDFSYYGDGIVGNRNSKQRLVFVNGKLGMGSPDGGRNYWDSDFVAEALKSTGSDDSYFISVDYNYSSSANERFNDGANSVVKGDGLTSGLLKDKDTFAFVTHSMGAAYAEGMIYKLQKDGWKVSAAYHFSAFQAADIRSHANFTFDFQMKNDWVINRLPNSSPGNIRGATPIRDESKAKWDQIHREVIDINAKSTWKKIK